MTANINPTVSVIVPIYNAMPHLKQCLESILAQTYPDIEIICVNDGSTDSSLEVLTSYGTSDDRIKIIDKSNAGYGHSVNQGLQAAAGDWISIIEPDDFIDKNMYKDLLANAYLEDGGIPDIVKSSYWCYFSFAEDSKPYYAASNLMNCMPKRRTEFTVFDNVEVLRHHPSIWSAIYRKDFLNQYQIRMIEPPGAGWADNPWLFETLLQAESIVWIPAAYYYYREDNPNGSSKLSDYHIPFDRLRDIRFVYARLKIEDTKLLQVFYQRSFNYINLTILKDSKFPENDPELQSCIRESLQSMDEQLVLEKNNGIPGWAKNYYKDFMGTHINEIPTHSPLEDPLVSFIIPFHNDREVLWPTLDSILAQTEGRFEVIGIDCASQDRCAEIFTELANKDARFTLLSERAESVVEGYNLGQIRAKGRYIWFLRPGCEVAHPSTLRELFRNNVFNSIEGRFPDCLATGANLHYFALQNGKQEMGENSTLQILTLGNEAGIVSNVSLAVCSHAWNRDRLNGAIAAFTNKDDEDGYTYTARMLLSCEDVLLIKEPGVRRHLRSQMNLDNIENQGQIIEHELEKYRTIYNDAEQRNSEAALLAARHCIIKCIDYASSFIGKRSMREDYYLALKNTFFNDFGLHEVPASDYVVYDQYNHLQRVFASNYENLLVSRMQDAAVSRDSAMRRLRRIEKSRSYKVARKLSECIKIIIPRRPSKN